MDNNTNAHPPTVCDTSMFDSSLLKRGDYIRETRTLRIEFQNGVERDYVEVPESVWEELKTAGSPGRYFNQAIRPFYTGINRWGGARG